MDIDHLRCFCYVYETRSLSRAAESWFFTRQGVSKLVKRLEADWGTELFRRTRTGLEPTSAADDIYPLVKRVVRDYDDVLATLRRRERGTSALAVPIARGVVSSLGSEVFAEFGRIHPQIELDLSVEEAGAPLTAVAEGRRQIAIDACPAPSGGPRSAVLVREDVYLVGSRSLLDTGGSIPRGTRLYIFGKGFSFDALVLDALGDRLHDFELVEGMATYDTAVDLVKAGSGATIAPASTLGAFAGADVFTEKIGGGDLAWTVSVAVADDDALSPEARLLLDHLVAWRDEGRWG